MSSHEEAAVGTGQTYKNIPSAVCQKFTISAVASEKTGRLIVPEPDGRKKKNIRTEFMSDRDWIVVVDHPGTRL